MDLKKELKLPSEPEEMLKELIGFKQHLHDDQSDVDWDSEAIWLKNMIPSYLWKSWKLTLAKVGFTWPKFLKQMKYHTRDMKRLLEKEISWNDFTTILIKALDEDAKKK